MYFNTFLPSNWISALIRTAIALTAFYFIMNFILFKNNFILKLIFHEFFALVLLSDLLYFKYFNTLPSVAELKMLHIIPSLLDCIRELFKPQYLILFSDILVLIFFHYRCGRRAEAFHKAFRFNFVVALVLLTAIILDSAFYGSNNSYQMYDTYGLLHFHGSQIKNTLISNESYHSSTVLIKSLEKTSTNNIAPQKNFGIAKGRNVIIIQVEALQDFVINRTYNGQEITPNLNKLIKEDSIYFNSYYYNIAKGGTSDAEFSTLNSLYPASDAPSYSKYPNISLYGLPKILKDQNYSTVAFHGFTPEFWNRAEMYPTVGFDHFLSIDKLKRDEIIGWGISDKSMLKQASKYIMKVKQPICAFIVTLTCHYPYNLPAGSKKLKLPEKQSTFIERYLQSVNYTDAALGVFINELKKSSIYENSIIAIYGDHHAIGCSDPSLVNQMTELLGKRYDQSEMANVPLIINIPNSNLHETNSIVGSQLDFMPTMLNLLGIDKGNIKFYGQDLNNAKIGFATTQLVLTKGSFIDDEKVFLMSADGVFENSTAWDRLTKAPIDIEECRAGYEKVIKENEECSYLLSNDLLLEYALETDKEIIDNDLPAPTNVMQRFAQLITLALKTH
jgi:phosphoglycerol transferase MdoB-like AlkP superfamily enzyme